MGSKLGLILSMGMLFIAFLFGADLVMMQINYTDLDALSTYTSYKIAKERRISSYLEDTLLEKGIYIVELNPKEDEYQSGDTFSYKLVKEYTPLIMGNKAFEITIVRHTIISFYN